MNPTGMGGPFVSMAADAGSVAPRPEDDQDRLIRPQRSLPQRLPLNSSVTLLPSPMTSNGTGCQSSSFQSAVSANAPPSMFVSSESSPSIHTQTRSFVDDKTPTVATNGFSRSNDARIPGGPEHRQSMSHRSEIRANVMLAVDTLQSDIPIPLANIASPHSFDTTRTTSSAPLALPSTSSTPAPPEAASSATAPMEEKIKPFFVFLSDFVMLLPSCLRQREVQTRSWTSREWCSRPELRTAYHNAITGAPPPEPVQSQPPRLSVPIPPNAEEEELIRSIVDGLMRKALDGTLASRRKDFLTAAH
ncbi:hypothetical protein HGRIS_009818 [Hohenbuehelia grisea]|uniref:Uncharacterized protein n=1 Tax=Hohenbuehelia grisea TaxID=104357 RepID=A0ABR3J2D5_9AGAR